MVTARSPRMPRTRPSAGLLHLLGLTLLLLALACAHGSGGSHDPSDHATAPHAQVSTTARDATAPDATAPDATAPDAAVRTLAIQADTVAAEALRIDAAPADTTRAAAARRGLAVPVTDSVGRHDPAHPVHACVPLSPRATPALDAPPAPATPVEDRAPVGAPASRGTVRAAGPVGDDTLAHTRSSAVLRV
ncbi:hypothetical protein [Streptomyces sp. NPDC058157]|uniref:hypothetical protein n=1 Tax=Streptomyces sp. NPDC058157 TaxID=3346360 RepID=UPI0036EA15C2